MILPATLYCILQIFQLIYLQLVVLPNPLFIGVDSTHIAGIGRHIKTGITLTPFKYFINTKFMNKITIRQHFLTEHKTPNTCTRQ